MKSIRLLVSVSVCMISLSTAAVYVQAQRGDRNQQGPGGAGGGQGTTVQDPGVRASSSTTGPASNHSVVGAASVFPGRYGSLRSDRFGQRWRSQ